MGQVVHQSIVLIFEFFIYVITGETMLLNAAVLRIHQALWKFFAKIIVDKAESLVE